MKQEHLWHSWLWNLYPCIICSSTVCTFCFKKKKTITFIAHSISLPLKSFSPAWHSWFLCNLHNDFHQNRWSQEKKTYTRSKSGFHCCYFLFWMLPLITYISTFLISFSAKESTSDPSVDSITKLPKMVERLKNPWHDFPACEDPGPAASERAGA